jgi:hypothetical protein
MAGRPRGTTICHPERDHYANGQCSTCWARDYRATHRDRMRPSLNAANRRWYSKNKAPKLASLRRKRLKREYGLTIQMYEDMLTSQNGLCAICQRPPGQIRLAVDHNHMTGAVRGLLCGGCNGMLGTARDNPAILRSGADYLERR